MKVLCPLLLVVTLALTSSGARAADGVAPAPDGDRILLPKGACAWRATWSARCMSACVQ